MAEAPRHGPAHPLPVGLEVAERLLDLLGLGIGEGQLAGRAEERFDISAVEFGEPLAEPGAPQRHRSQHRVEALGRSS